ncbi:MAG: beta-propeller fold lactonase family protein [Terriglobales bacterium]
MNLSLRWWNTPAFGVLLLVSVLILSSCGDVYRPVANPVTPPGGDPQIFRFAMVVNNNGNGVGSVSAINVSGDTNGGNFQVGRNAVHGWLVPSVARAFTANQADDTLSSLFPGVVGSAVAFITLPAGSAPRYVYTNETTNLYVAEAGTNKIGVVSVASLVLATEIALPGGSTTPVALVETPDNTHLYSVNQGSGDVTVIAVPANTVQTTIPVGASPVAAVINPDGKTLYVLNQGSGTVSVIDIASNAVIATLTVGVSPRFLAYDNKLRRLYVANTGESTISVFSADVGTPTLLKTVTVGAGPASLTPLADGTKVYVANAGCADPTLLPAALGACSGNTVSVVDALSLTVRKTITVGNAPVSLGSDPESTKVIVANRDSNTITSIATASDTISNTLTAGSPNPVFVLVSH